MTNVSPANPDEQPIICYGQHGEHAPAHHGGLRGIYRETPIEGRADLTLAVQRAVPGELCVGTFIRPKLDKLATDLGAVAFVGELPALAFHAAIISLCRNGRDAMSAPHSIDLRVGDADEPQFTYALNGLTPKEAAILHTVWGRIFRDRVRRGGAPPIDFPGYLAELHGAFDSLRDRPGRNGKRPTHPECAAIVEIDLDTSIQRFKRAKTSWTRETKAW